MTDIVLNLLVGIALVGVGALVIATAPNDAANVGGWLVVGVGALMVSAGVVAWGVFMGLRARDTRAGD